MIPFFVDCVDYTKRKYNFFVDYTGQKCNKVKYKLKGL